MIRGYVVRELADGGVVIVHHATGIPLPISVRAFDCEEDGEAFLLWLGETTTDPRYMCALQLKRHVDQWKREQAWPECETAGCIHRVELGGRCEGCLDELEEAS
jgi:hypothetical protein